VVGVHQIVSLIGVFTCAAARTDFAFAGFGAMPYISPNAFV
jgi:hypothetical protein